jgi:DNA-binding NtrC family response regulator
VRAVNDARHALAALETEAFDLVLSDLKMHDPRTGVLTEQAGHSLLREVKRLYPGTPVVLITGNQQIETAVGAIKAGALDYITKPFRVKEIEEKVVRALASGRARDAAEEGLTGCVDAGPELDTASPAMRAVLETARRAAERDDPILISGPAGSGKEFLARWIHARSPRARQPFLAAPCGGIPPALFEDELFGHERGAFTGANRLRRGLFEQAAGGTLYLDLIEETPLGLQGKLVPPVEKRELRRIGASRPSAFAARIFASSTLDLRTLVNEGHFRADLYFALRVIHLEVPPLSQRPEDIPALAFAFLREAARAQKRNLLFEPTGVGLLQRQTYRGNVRELRNIVLATAALAEGGLICQEHVERALETTRQGAPATTVHDVVAHAERERIRLALARNPNSRSAAARELGISRTTLWRKVLQLGLEQGVQG